MNFRDYIAVLQGNDVIDAKSLDNYGAMIEPLNALIMRAADKTLDINAEPHSRGMLRLAGARSIQPSGLL